MRNSSDENAEQENCEFREMFLTYNPGDKKQDSEVEETELKDQIIIEDVREVEVENFKQLLKEGIKILKCTFSHMMFFLNPLCVCSQKVF